jgi:hypothetical protein
VEKSAVAVAVEVAFAVAVAVEVAFAVACSLCLSFRSAAEESAVEFAVVCLSSKPSKQSSSRPKLLTVSS